MSHQFFDFDTLEQGTTKMVELIKKLYPTAKLQEKVQPNITPGFLRQKLSEQPPEQGCTVDELINQTQNVIAPGIMHWQSPKFFGYFPSIHTVTSVIAQMFASTFQTPGFNYSLSPSQTELENLVVDWATLALGLPQKFLFKNTGGAVLNWSATEAVFLTVHAAKRRKMAEINAIQNRQKILKFVGYYSDFSFVGNERGLKLKQIFYTRAVPSKYSKQAQNFMIDIEQFRKMVEKDIADGLIPFWYGATYGSTFSGAIDICPELVQICRKHKIWINVDAAYLGTSFICPELRPDMKIFEQVDSFITNFSKAMLVGVPGTVLFVGDKDQFTATFQSDLSFSFFKNKYSQKKTVVDYKDWGIGLARKFNSLKFFYMFKFYGLKRLQAFVRNTVYKREETVKRIQQNKNFKIFAKPKFGLICFQLCNKEGHPSNKLTKVLGQKIKNIPEGYMSPGDFREYSILRIPIGNNNATLEIINRYLQKIMEIGNQIIYQQQNN